MNQKEKDVTETDQVFLGSLVMRNRYLTMATLAGKHPWIAPLEYIADDALNLYFFSPESASHSRHIEDHKHVAISIFDAIQPEYEPAKVMRISGTQIVAEVEKLFAPYPELVRNQIESWQLPMPPYAAYRITPIQWFIPVLKDGVNDRLEVMMS